MQFHDGAELRDRVVRVDWRIYNSGGHPHPKASWVSSYRRHSYCGAVVDIESHCEETLADYAGKARSGILRSRFASAPEANQSPQRPV
jgi:hypothetical protein